MSTTPQILEKLEKLEKEFSVPSAFNSELTTIREWGKDIRKNLAITQLKNNLGVQGIIEEMKRKKDRCTLSLSEDKTLDNDSEERKAIRRERECWRWFINIFDGAEKSLSSVEKEIDDNLE